MKLWQKLKPNVLIVVAIVGVLIYVFARLLIPELTAQVSNEILALLIGIGIGGLLGIAGALATDGPPDHLGAALKLLAERFGRYGETPEERAFQAAENALQREADIEVARIAAGGTDSGTDQTT